MPVLQDLHWLPIKFHIDFKILLLTFKCLNGRAPLYLIMVNSNTKYNLRSSVAPTLNTAKVRTLVTLGGRAFQSAAPKLGSNLPANIRQIESLDNFKTHLKTHLFKLAYY